MYLILLGEVTEDSTVFPWEQLTGFQRLLIIKVLRPGQLVESVRQFVEDQLSSNYLSTGAFDLKEIYDESSAKTPLIFILSPGLYNCQNGKIFILGNLQLFHNLVLFTKVCFYMTMWGNVKNLLTFGTILLWNSLTINCIHLFYGCDFLTEYRMFQIPLGHNCHC